MGAGSSKRVHPEAAFHAADTDKDGKLTPQELGAMLRAKGIAWSPKRIEGLLCAFDDVFAFFSGVPIFAFFSGVAFFAFFSGGTIRIFQRWNSRSSTTKISIFFQPGGTFRYHPAIGV